MTMKQFLDELKIYTKYFSPEAMDFYNTLKEQSNNTFTENGEKILQCMQHNKNNYSNGFTSKQLGELLFMSPRSVSGAMKKLINEGYVIKIAITPIAYKLTELGEETVFDN